MEKKWVWHPICQRPTMGRKWWLGNFTFGIVVDSHSRFFNFIICLWFIEIGISGHEVRSAL